jgi:Leucine-rich repeat (LRR) protein
MSNIDIEDLSLNNNSLNRVPDIAFSFEKLHSLSLSSNTIPVLLSGSLVFSAPQVDYVGLENLSLDIIEVGAFEGMIIGN